MVDVDTFLTILYVMADDFCKTSLPPEPHPGPQAALSRSEVVTLVLCGQWQGFGSEQGLYRMPNVISGPPFHRCPRGSNIIGRSVGSTPPSSPFFCISSGSWRPSAVPMKPSTAPGARPGVPVVCVQETTIRGSMVKTVEENEGLRPRISWT
jgi:hypothetical protein